MSKLLKLKEWLTLEEAARHLSLAFGEDVTPADILRLALDGHAQLSVHLVNGAEARWWAVVDHSDVTWTDVPGLEGEVVRLFDPPVMQIEGGPLVQLLAGVTNLAPGVWDLPLVGAERIDVENEYQKRMGGPECSLVSLDGAFVRSNREDEGRRPYYELVTSGAIGPSSSSLTEFCKRWRERLIYPSHLPDDSVLVVRTCELLRLQANARESQPQEIRDPKPHEPDRSHVSDDLARVNQAARRWWGNVDKCDPSTHPTNATVAAWLIERGLSKSQAERAASLIRPEWAHTGRKPDV